MRKGLSNVFNPVSMAVAAVMAAMMLSACHGNPDEVSPRVSGAATVAGYDQGQSDARQHAEGDDDHHGESADDHHAEGDDDHHAERDDDHHAEGDDDHHAEGDDDQHAKGGDDQHADSADDRHGEGGDDHHGEGEELSDLDRSVEELFAANCEHGLKTHACDNCRPEVGVVKAPATLFDAGLLSTVTPERREVSVPLAVTGEVQFDERRVAHVSTQVEGIIRRVHVSLGDKVERGQPLVEIESAAIGEAQAGYLEELGMRELARRSYDRLLALRRDGIASEKELLEARQKLETAQIRTDAALGKLTRLGLDPQSAKTLAKSDSTGKLVLRSPTDGTVLEMHAVAGEVAKSETSVATVGDNSSLWVWADIYERDVAAVMQGQSLHPLAASITVRAFPGVEFQGSVDFVSPSMDRTSRTVKVRIGVPNPDGRLLAGMFAAVEIFLPGDRKVLTVPASAVTEDEGRSFVFIHRDEDYYVRRPVTRGRTLAQTTEIMAGLDGDETVVAEGSFLLKSDVLRSKMGAGCAD